MRVTITHQKFKGGWEGLKKRLGAAWDDVAVGVPDGAPNYVRHTKTGTIPGPAMADVARWNHNGTTTRTARIPPRPFLKNTLKAKNRSYTQMLEVIARLTMQGAIGASKARRNLGNRASLDVKRTIDDFSDPVNAPLTIAKKGFNDPLVHTLALRNHIDWWIEEGGGDN
jgi:hypothetical protein